MKKAKPLVFLTILILMFSFLFSINMVHAFVPVLTSTAQTETTVTLSWNKSDDLTFDAYYVTYATSVNGPYTTVATITDKSQTAYAVVGLTPNTAYYFIVKDEYSPNLGLTKSTSSSNTYQANTMAKPTIGISAQTTTTASLQWTDYNTYSTQEPFVSYTIQMSTSGSNGPWTTVATITDSTQNSYLITGLSTGLYYVYMYDTVGTTGNTQTTSTSNYAVISNVAVSISNTSPTTVYQGQQVQFSATASGGSSHYNYQWYADGNAISGATSSSLSFTPTAVHTYAITCSIQDATYTNSQATSNSIPVTAIQPTPAPTQPIQPQTQPPTNPTQPPINPTQPPVNPTQPSNTTPPQESTFTPIVLALIVVVVVVVIGALVVVILKTKNKPKSP